MLSKPRQKKSTTTTTNVQTNDCKRIKFFAMLRGVNYALAAINNVVIISIAAFKSNGKVFIFLSFGARFTCSFLSLACSSRALNKIRCLQSQVIITCYGFRWVEIGLWPKAEMRMKIRHNSKLFRQRLPHWRWRIETLNQKFNQFDLILIRPNEE